MRLKLRLIHLAIIRLVFKTRSTLADLATFYRFSPCSHKTGTKITNLLIYSPRLHAIVFYSALSSMRCFEAERAAETGLKDICVHIHPALDSSRSEDSQLGPDGGMTSDWSEE